jgi:hypothetical protein
MPNSDAVLVGTMIAVVAGYEVLTLAMRMPPHERLRLWREGRAERDARRAAPPRGNAEAPQSAPRRRHYHTSRRQGGSR